MPPPLNFTFGAIWRVSLIMLVLWMIGDALDGGSQSIVPPLLVAAWLYLIVLLDRWVTRGFQRVDGDRHQGLSELIGKGR